MCDFEVRSTFGTSIDCTIAYHRSLMQTTTNVLEYALTPYAFVCIVFALTTQLHLGVESIRAPEVLFQPSMIGISEAGVLETIDFVLKQFSAEDQLLLTKHIFLTGGCSNFKGKTVGLTCSVDLPQFDSNVFGQILFGSFRIKGAPNA